MATRRSLSLEAARGGSDSWTQQVIRFCIHPPSCTRNRVAPLADALEQGGASPAAPSTPLAVRGTYPSFRALTCVHVNCDDTRLLACGYSNDVAVFDVETGGLVRKFVRAHSGERLTTRLPPLLLRLLLLPVLLVLPLLLLLLLLYRRAHKHLALRAPLAQRLCDEQPGPDDQALGPEGSRSWGGRGRRGRGATALRRRLRAPERHAVLPPGRRAAAVGGRRQ